MRGLPCPLWVWECSTHMDVCVCACMCVHLYVCMYSFMYILGVGNLYDVNYTAAIQVHIAV